MTLKKLLAALALVALACGKRGDPRPPVPIIPQATSDLVVTQRADRLILSWSYPALTTAGRSLTEIDNITVFRYVEELPVAPAGSDVPTELDPSIPQPMALFGRIPTLPQAQFEKLSTRVDSIEKANLASVTTGTKLIYTDAPPFRAQDGRPVRVTYAVVTEGGTGRSELSNLATIVPLAVGLPPVNVTATAKAEGVTLSWDAPTQSIGNQGTPVILGYNIYRTAPGEEPGVFATAINNAPVKSPTYTDTPPYGEHEYRVTAVADTRIQGNPSAPVRTTFRDLVAPPAPASVSALLETKVVRLLWDAVEAPDLAGYRVYRTEGVGHVNIKEVGTIPLVNEIVTATTISDPGVDLGIAYRYGVAAIDKSGNESKRVWTDWVVAPKTP